MVVRRLSIIAALGAALAFPAVAQTTQTSPTKPAPVLTTPSPAAGPGTTATPSNPSSSLIDINSASAADLDKLPGVGTSRAAAIVKNRPYKGKDDLLSRHIVPTNVYKNIKNKIIAKQG